MAVSTTDLNPVASPTFLALRLYGNQDLRLDQVAPLPCGPDEVRIQVAYCGICGSDLHEWHDGPILAPKGDTPDKLTGVRLPVTMGHEVSGTITEIGSSVADGALQVGDHIAMHPALHDREWARDPCGLCAMGQFNLCENISYYGIGAPCGGFGREMVIKAKNAFVLPPTISLKEGALVEPLTVAWHSVRMSGIQSGQDAVVLGAGPIGLGIISVLRYWGVKTIIVSEIGTKRKEHARMLGADVVVDPTSTQSPGVDPVVVEARGRTEGHAGVHVAFDATGLQSTLTTAIAAIRPGGTVFNVAVHKQPLVIDVNSVSLWEKKLTGGIGASDDDFRGVIAAMASGGLRTEGFITSVVKLSHAVQGGLRELLNNRDEHIKILIEPE